MDDLESAVARHYQVSDLGAVILLALAAAGLDPPSSTSGWLHRRARRRRLDSTF